MMVPGVENSLITIHQAVIVSVQLPARRRDDVRALMRVILFCKWNCEPGMNQGMSARKACGQNRSLAWPQLNNA